MNEENKMILAKEVAKMCIESYDQGGLDAIESFEEAVKDCEETFDKSLREKGISVLYDIIKIAKGGWLNKKAEGQNDLP